MLLASFALFVAVVYAGPPLIGTRATDTLGYVLFIVGILCVAVLMIRCVIAILEAGHALVGFAWRYRDRSGTGRRSGEVRILDVIVGAAGWSLLSLLSGLSLLSALLGGVIVGSILATVSRWRRWPTVARRRWPEPTGHAGNEHDEPQPWASPPQSSPIRPSTSAGALFDEATGVRIGWVLLLVAAIAGVIVLTVDTRDRLRRPGAR